MKALMTVLRHHLTAGQRGRHRGIAPGDGAWDGGRVGAGGGDDVSDFLGDGDVANLLAPPSRGSSPSRGFRALGSRGSSPSRGCDRRPLQADAASADKGHDWFVDSWEASGA